LDSRLGGNSHKEKKEKVCMQIKNRNNKVSFGNQQVNKFQLFTDDWSKNNTVKRNKKVSIKYRENKEKERMFLRKILTLSVTHISDGHIPFRFHVPKISKLLNIQQAFSDF
jgi:hypothetical protein